MLESKQYAISMLFRAYDTEESTLAARMLDKFQGSIPYRLLKKAVAHVVIKKEDRETFPPMFFITQAMGNVCF